MQISWVSTTIEDGVFPKFPVTKQEERKNSGDTVYHIPSVKQPELDYLEGKGFEIVRDRSKMALGKVFLEREYANENLGVKGALYAYKRDLEQKLAAEAPMPSVAIGGSAPRVLSSQ